MQKETGNTNFPIWLLGDSNPKNWQDKLDTPLDPRHPAVHNIWTPIIDIIQREVYLKIRKRIDTQPIYIRNAVENSLMKPQRNKEVWDPELVNHVKDFGRQVGTYKPVFILSFGALAFEFARRSVEQSTVFKYGQWNSLKLGGELQSRMSDFSIKKINLIPLLHVSIARGSFLKGHKNFCGGDENANYFEYVGVKLAEKIIQYEKTLDVRFIDVNGFFVRRLNQDQFEDAN